MRKLLRFNALAYCRHIKFLVCCTQDRLETLGHVRDAGISVCAGGIIGLGEGEKDRVGLLHQVLRPPPIARWYPRSKAS